MKAPDRTTAAAFQRYLGGEVMADSAMLHWTGLYVRLCRLPRVVDSRYSPMRTAGRGGQSGALG